MNTEGERLQKFLARAGHGSRRSTELLIEDGRVTVDGVRAELGRRVLPGQRVEVDGVIVVDDPRLVHYLLNKPTGVVSTSDDPQGRITVVELVPEEPRVFSIGRLDYDTSGLLIMTNDGDLANLLSHPRYSVPKTYVAEVAGVPSPGSLAAWRRGVALEDGVTAPAEVKILARAPDSTLLEIVVHEGRNRLIRRVADEIGHPVLTLARTKIGPLSDSKLSPGTWRPLLPQEVHQLRAAATLPEADGK